MHIYKIINVWYNEKIKAKINCNISEQVIIMINNKNKNLLMYKI